MMEMDSAICVDAETTTLTFIVHNARAINSKALFAMVDVEVQIAGVTIDIVGVQARRLLDGGTSVSLPTFKDEGGVWRHRLVKWRPGRGGTGGERPRSTRQSRTPRYPPHAHDDAAHSRASSRSRI
jgi:hypothetical protein